MGTPIPRVAILAYHDILPAAEASLHNQGQIPISRWEEHMAWLDRAGYELIDLAHAFERLATDADDLGTPAVAITFDDAYQGVMTVLERGWRRPAAVFVLTEQVGASTLGWNTRSPSIQHHCTLEQLQALHGSGFELEFHGVDHHNLAKFSTDEIQARCARGIAWFERHLGRRPRYLAYPYGCCDTRICDAVAPFFDGAVSVNHGSWSGLAARYALNRISVPAFLTGEDLGAVLQTDPAQRWLAIQSRAPGHRGDESNSGVRVISGAGPRISGVGMM
jgi:peptidoglycan/xylan/chitin deacetylase (PgdA/CDA1 family)